MELEICLVALAEPVAQEVPATFWAVLEVEQAGLPPRLELLAGLAMLLVVLVIFWVGLEALRVVQELWVVFSAANSKSRPRRSNRPV